MSATPDHVLTFAWIAPPSNDDFAHARRMALDFFGLCEDDSRRLITECDVDFVKTHRDDDRHATVAIPTYHLIRFFVDKERGD